jgi:hypothetical protein
MKSLQIKTSIGKDTTLNFSMLNSGTKEAVLMHMAAILDAIKKCDHFQAYKEAQALYAAKKEAAKQLKAGLSLLDGASGDSRKSTKSAQKAKEAKGVTEAPDQEMQATFQEDLKRAKKAAENAKGAMTAAASKMFVFYANLLSVEAKNAWNKIIEEQMEGKLYVDHQGVLQKGSRGVSHQWFKNCVMFHLLAMFPINAAKQEKYYITNILKKPQHVNVDQFVRHVEQLNPYISQMRCFYKSLSFNATNKPENVPFTEAELGSHVLRMCPLQ